MQHTSKKDFMNLRYDVFNAERLQGATFTGDFEFPVIRGIKLDIIPNQIVSLDKLNKNNCKGSLVHEYVDDFKYDRVYTRSNKYLTLLKQAAVVIGIDHSTYRDLPLSEQIHSIYLNRATDFWWQRNGIRVIPNVSCGNEKTYTCFCNGIEPGTTIAMSSSGNKGRAVDRRYFTECVRLAIHKLLPYSILIHGPISAEVQGIADYYHVRLLRIPTRLELAHQRKAA